MYSRVYVEITNICNMSCSFCHGHSRLPRRMTEEELLKVLEQLKGHTSYLYYHLMGEPLTHPLLPHFIKLAGERGFRSMITTNGTLLAARGRELIEAGLHKVNISLHSFEGEDETAHRRYLSRVADFAGEAAAAGIIVVLRLWNKGFDEGKNREALDLLKQRFPAPWVENNRGLKLQDKLFLEWGDRFEWPDREAARGDACLSCYGLRDHFGILADGTVVPCCLDSDGVIKLGNIFEEDLTAVLQSPRALAIKHGFECRRAVEDLCRRCGYARRF